MADSVKTVPSSPAAPDAEFELFAHALAHDLRAPLRAIGGFSEVLLETPEGKLEPLAREYLPRIVAATARMAQLLEDLLELARIANAACNPQDTNLSHYAEQIVAHLRGAAPQRKVAISIEPECVVKGDPHLLHTALERLLANAWKFSAQTAASTIEMGCRREEKETTVWIRDNGIGFDPEHAHRLFLPLQRLHRADQFAGSGVGLAIVKRVVDRHGGRVWAQNLEEGGACFGFVLPA